MKHFRMGNLLEILVKKWLVVPNNKNIFLILKNSKGYHKIGVRYNLILFFQWNPLSVLYLKENKWLKKSNKK